MPKKDNTITVTAVTSTNGDGNDADGVDVIASHRRTESSVWPKVTNI